MLAVTAPQHPPSRCSLDLPKPLSFSPTFGLEGVVGRPPPILCPVHGLVVLQIWRRLWVQAQLWDDFCGIILEGLPSLARPPKEGGLQQQANETQGKRELHGATEEAPTGLPLAQARSPAQTLWPF